jgi:hypothetical protein
MSLNENAKSEEIFEPFLDLSTDIKPWLQIQAVDTSRDAALGLINEMACAWLQEYLGRPITPTEYTRRFDGNSGWMGSYLMLPRSPVLEVKKVVEYRGVNGAYTLPESTPTNQVDGWQCVYSTGRLNRVFPGNVAKPWFPGMRNVEVTWIAGYNPVPATLRMAALQLVHHWFHHTQQQSALHAGNFREFNDEELKAGPFESVPIQIIALLEPYMRFSLG